MFSMERFTHVAIRQEGQERLLSLIALVLVSYSIKFLEFVAFDSVSIVWAIAAVISVGAIRYRDGLAFFFIVGLFAISWSFSYVHGFITTASLKNLLVFSSLGGATIYLLNLDSDNSRALLYFNRFVALVVVFCALFLTYKGEHYSIYLGEEFRASYLIVSDLVSIFCLIYLLCYRNIEAIVVVFFSLVVVFFLGSRSSMVFLIGAAALGVWFVFLSTAGHYLTKLFLIVVAVIGVWQLAIFVIDNHDRFYRLFSILEMSHDSSYLERLQLQNYFFDSLDTPFCFLVGCGPASDGGYVHNLLSVWQYFGFPLFLVVVILVMISLLYMLLIKSGMLPLYVFVLAQMVFARSWNSVTFALLVSISLYMCFRYMGTQERIRVE